MTEDEFNRLVEDIKANGLRVPITIYENKITVAIDTRRPRRLVVR
jgi:hypothetical protein